VRLSDTCIKRRQIQGRHSAGVDLVNIFRTVQALEPDPYRFDVTERRGVRDVAVQDHRRVLASQGQKHSGPIEISRWLVAARDDEQCRVFHEYPRARFTAALLRLCGLRGAADPRDKTGFLAAADALGVRERG
jgi:hypothetical protein